MNVAIATIGTGKKNTKISRIELVEAIQSLGHSVFFITSEKKDADLVRRNEYGISYITTPIQRNNINPLKELKAMWVARKRIKENKIDALLIYGIKMMPSVVPAAKLAGVKRIVCVVNGAGRLFELAGARGFLVRLMSYPMLWLSFLLADSVLFQNPDNLNMIKGKGLLWKNNHRLVNGSGVNLENFEFFELADEFVFLMIARLTGDKGVNEYIRAAMMVKEEYPESIFYLVGPMDNDDSSLDINSLNKAVDNKTITLTGKVDDVRSYIKQARFYVLPSYHEGTPRTVLEAMAMGRPIITTDAPGCRETVKDGVNGFLVPVKDSVTLAEKMVWMIKNSDKVEIMGKNSRVLCEEKYNVYKVNEVILDELGL